MKHSEPLMIGLVWIPRREILGAHRGQIGLRHPEEARIAALSDKGLGYLIPIGSSRADQQNG
jgi:hypothetical protein